MALYFTKRRRWPPSKPVQFILAFLGLFLAIAILLTWLLIRYQQTGPSTTTEPSPSTSVITEKPTEVGHSLLIFDINGAERFVLMQANPNTNRINAVPIPSEMVDADGCPLDEALHRHGAPQVTKTVSDALSLPVQHYISFSPEGVEQFLNQLDNGVLFQVPEAVTYTDTNGVAIHLNAGQHRLTSGQVRSLLEYAGWKKSKTRDNLAADLTAATLNQYLVQGRSLEGYFASISNAATTDLRIDNFNAYRATLAHLAEQNTGDLCRRVNLTGTKKNGVFYPDLEAIRRETDLYQSP